MTNKLPPLEEFSPNYEPEAELEAIREFLHVVFSWKNELAAETAEPITTDNVDRDVEDHVNRLHNLVYQDAACSHAAVGALAPFFEGMFIHEFSYLRKLHNGEPLSEHHRWKLSANHFWNPHCVSDKGTIAKKHDIVRGAMQLVKALCIDGTFQERDLTVWESARYTGIERQFPSEMDNTLRALFTYRNRALHNGYEWPRTAREEFFKLCEDKGWADWFAWSTSGGAPWIASMKDLFILQCLDVAATASKTFELIRFDWLMKYRGPVIGESGT
jgi:hypothetical protein